MSEFVGILVVDESEVPPPPTLTDTFRQLLAEQVHLHTPARMAYICGLLTAWRISQQAEPEALALYRALAADFAVQQRVEVAEIEARVAETARRYIAAVRPFLQGGPD